MGNSTEGYFLFTPEKFTPVLSRNLLGVQDNTMLVQGQRSFSHEEFRGVVYSKYIQSPETMVRLHIQMARYFARLPASDRKVLTSV